MHHCLVMPRPGRGHFEIARSARLSVPWHSCLGCRHAGCLRLSHRRPAEMYGLRTRPQTDVTRRDFCHRRTTVGGGHIVSPPPGLERTVVRIVLLAQYVKCIGTAHAFDVGRLAVNGCCCCCCSLPSFTDSDNLFWQLRQAG